MQNNSRTTTVVWRQLLHKLDISINMKNTRYETVDKAVHTWSQTTDLASESTLSADLLMKYRWASTSCVWTSINGKLHQSHHHHHHHHCYHYHHHQQQQQQLELRYSTEMFYIRPMTRQNYTLTTMLTSIFHVFMGYSTILQRYPRKSLKTARAFYRHIRQITTKEIATFVNICTLMFMPSLAFKVCLHPASSAHKQTTELYQRKERLKEVSRSP